MLYLLYLMPKNIGIIIFFSGQHFKRCCLCCTNVVHLFIFVVQNELFDTITIKRNDDINERLTEEDIVSEYDGEE